jgi:hypothetical protein
VEEELITKGEVGLRQQQTKKIVFDTVPAVLILYFRRFDFAELGQFAKNQGSALSYSSLISGTWSLRSLIGS